MELGLQSGLITISIKMFPRSARHRDLYITGRIIFLTKCLLEVITIVDCHKRFKHNSTFIEILLKYCMLLL